MHVKVLKVVKGLERYINLYMYSLLHVLLSIFIDTIYCYIILYLVYVPRTNFKNGLIWWLSDTGITPNPDYLHKSSGKFNITTFAYEAVL